MTWGNPQVLLLCDRGLSHKKHPTIAGVICEESDWFSHNLGHRTEDSSGPIHQDSVLLGAGYWIL